MFTKYFTCNTNRKKIARLVKITIVQEKSSRPEKWKLNEIIVCYSDEYATNITDILNKTISQKVL